MTSKVIFSHTDAISLYLDSSLYNFLLLKYSKPHPVCGFNQIYILNSGMTSSKQHLFTLRQLKVQSPDNATFHTWVFFPIETEIMLFSFFSRLLFKGINWIAIDRCSLHWKVLKNAENIRCQRAILKTLIEIHAETVKYQACLSVNAKT